MVNTKANKRRKIIGTPRGLGVYNEATPADGPAPTCSHNHPPLQAPKLVLKSLIYHVGHT